VTKLLARTRLALRRVLVADDDDAARRLLCTLLDLREYGLLEATDGAAAVELARTERPDLAILDLPATSGGMTGIATCRAIRADAELVAIKIVIIAEHDRPGDRVAAHAAGADAYLAKPYSPLALLDHVQRLTRR
jgi:two-component system, OmpR family, phosphate regulon response regulator PhoB